MIIAFDSLAGEIVDKRMHILRASISTASDYTKTCQHDPKKNIFQTTKLMMAQRLIDRTQMHPIDGAVERSRAERKQLKQFN